MIPALISASRASHPATTANAFHELLVTDLRPELPRITVPLAVLYVVPPNSPLPPAQYDAAVRASYAAAPTALAHFGLDVAQMDLDGQVRGKETVTDTPRPLKEGLAIYLPFNDKTLADARSQSLKAEVFGKAAAGTGVKAAELVER